MLVSVTGTTNLTQMILNMLGSIQTPISGVPGQVSAYFGLLATSYWSAYEGALSSWLLANETVVIGHSLGGAEAEVLSAIAAAAGYEVTGTYVLGSPRAGDSVFADYISADTYRLENVGDPVPAVPPSIWGGLGYSNPFVSWVLAPLTPVLYQHPGTPTSLDIYGALGVGVSGEPTLAQATATILNFQFSPHFSEEYVRRLRRAWSPADSAPGANGYPHPDILLDYAYDVTVPSCC